MGIVGRKLRKSGAFPNKLYFILTGVMEALHQIVPWDESLPHLEPNGNFCEELRYARAKTSLNKEKSASIFSG